MATTKLFYIGSELASAPPFLRRFYIDDAGKRCYISLGTATASDWSEIQMVKKPAVSHTTSQTLTADDNGRILVFLGDDLGITLPASASLPVGWRTTIVNENPFVSQVDSATPHSLSVTDKPVGLKNLLVSRSGSDLVNGIGTQLHGFSLIIPPRECVDIWLTSSGEFGISASTTVGWRDLPTTPIGNALGGREPSFLQVETSFMYGLRFTDAGAGSEKLLYYSIHINHDYVMGTRVYPHVHWLSGNVVTTTTVGWAWEYAAVKGHGQQALPVSGTITTAATALNGIPYIHYVTEVSDANAIPATNLEPDTVIYFKFLRDSASAYGTGDNCVTSVWVTFVDAHYLSTDGGTPLKSPPFYL